MKRIKQSQRVELRPVVLYLDDLEEIFEIVKEITDKVIISTDDFEFESMDELKKLEKERINSLSIRTPTMEDRIVLTLGPRAVTLHLGAESPASRGIFERLKQLLHGHRRHLAWLYNDLMLFLDLILIGFGFMVLLWSALSTKQPYGILLGIVWILSGVIWFRWVWRIHDKQFSTIYIRKRIESPSFWKAKRYDIILAITSAIIGAIVGAFVTLVITKLSQ